MGQIFYALVQLCVKMQLYTVMVAIVSLLYNLKSLVKMPGNIFKKKKNNNCLFNYSISSSHRVFYEIIAARKKCCVCENMQSKLFDYKNKDKQICLEKERKNLFKHLCNINSIRNLKTEYFICSQFNLYYIETNNDENDL